jgi:class 3 adenylate cyclase/predicted ATPase
MDCPNCGHGNPELNRFCGACGTELVRVCTGCSRPNPPDHRFCGQCGERLESSRPAAREGRSIDPSTYTPKFVADRILAEKTAMESRGQREGERKTITALFADLKGSTALIEDLDPEEARAIIDPALQLMMDSVHRFDGYVAQALGDGIFALFGAPIAHEDHAHRALYAALRMQEEMRAYSDQLRLSGGTPLLLRIGANTGEVVVRSIRKNELHSDYVPVGHSTNIAARMQEMATPGTILVTQQTQRLTEGHFDLGPLGETLVKGSKEPLEVFEVTGAGPLRTKFQVSARRGLSRFVGRYPELQQIQQALEQGASGHGQVVGVMGEPGLGKSRLFYELKRALRRDCLVLEAYSRSHGKATPYLPVIELLKDYFKIELKDDERTRRAKVMGQVLSLDHGLEDTLPFILGVLGIADSTTSLEQMDPKIRRRRTFDALKRLLLQESLIQPVIVIVEDLHWVDGETQGFLDTLIESIASARVVLLVNYRPEFQHHWGGKTYYTQLHLTPLGEEEARELLTSLMGGDRQLDELKARILERTDGTPFFIEEVVQALNEEGILRGERGRYRVEQIPKELHISPNVQGVLAARIDRLAPDEKALLQQLAVIGRTFSPELVREVVSQGEHELSELLSSLQAKEFLHERPTLTGVEYVFKHALTQEVAYGTVLNEQRKILHERTASAMEALRHGDLEEHYAEIAFHYARGGSTEKAIEYLHLAGQQAAERSSYGEAVMHLTEALELLDTLDETPERSRQELVMQMALGTAQMVVRGYAAPEAGRAYARADDLCRQVEDVPELMDVLMGLWMFRLGKAEVAAARETAEQALQVAHAWNDPTALLKAHTAMSHSVFFQGQLEAARGHLDRCLALSEADHIEAPNVPVGGVDCRVRAHCYSAWCLWLLGYPDQALVSVKTAASVAEGHGDSYTLAWSMIFAASLHGWRGELQAVREHAEAALAMSREQGLIMTRAEGTIHRGTVTAGLGDGNGRVVQDATEAVALLRDSAMQGWLPYHLALLAEIHLAAGHVDDARCSTTEAIQLCARGGERWYEAELHRLEGELILRSPAAKSSATIQGEAEACFEKALHIAAEQRAMSLQLRASTSLARLWQRQDKQAEARQLLSESHGWFTEGFDTRDLREAKALLEELL